MDAAQLPLCFGTITGYAEGSDRCSGCVASATCSATVGALITHMRDKYRLEAVMRAHKVVKKSGRKNAQVSSDESRKQALAMTPVVPAPAPEVTTPTMQQNVMEETRVALRRMLSYGKADEIAASLKAGKNPFTKKTPEPWLMAELLLRNSATSQNITAAFDKAGISSLKTAAYRAAFVSLKLANSVDHSLKINL